MESHFTVEERRKDSLKRHIKDHCFEYILDFIGPILLTIFILYIAKANNYIIGIITSFVYSTIKFIYNLYHYKKEYVEIDIK